MPLPILLLRSQRFLGLEISVQIVGENASKRQHINIIAIPVGSIG